MINYKIIVKNSLRKKLDKKDNKLNRKKVCEALSISESTIDRWLSLNDSNCPKSENLPILCKVLNITLYELFDIKIPKDLNDALLNYS